MNAYELADLIGLCGDGGYNQDAANMLRKQADRIAELEKAAQRMVDEFAPHADKCRPCTIEWQNLRSVLFKVIK